MEVYYADDYGPFADEPARPSAGGSLKALIVSVLGLDSRRLPKTAPGRMLELGCATGEYLLLAQRLGWSVEGIEFSESAAETARRKGLNVQTGAVENCVVPSRPVDLVAAWMVLEHLHEPVQDLRRLRDCTKPDGWLAFSVPDANCLEFKLFRGSSYALQLPTHLYHYTAATLRTVLAAGGWELVQLRWQPNCVNLLMSLSYKFADWRMPRLQRLFVWLARSPKVSTLRLALGWLLARFHQSGRMEGWARRKRDVLDA